MFQAARAGLMLTSNSYGMASVKIRPSSQHIKSIPEIIHTGIHGRPREISGNVASASDDRPSRLSCLTAMDAENDTIMKRPVQ